MISGSLLCARAPGKVMLFGEYAVLHGAPALLAAVEPAALGTYTQSAMLTLDAGVHGRTTHSPQGWKGDPLPFATAYAARHAIPPGTYTLDTAGLSVDRHKLGLGSSAASTVLLALLAHHARGASSAPSPGALFALVHPIHRQVQGLGSGADVAAIAFGGLIRYRWQEAGTGPAEADAEAFAVEGGRATIASLPPHLTSITVAFTGRSASTPTLVRAVERARHEDPARVGAIVARLAAPDGLDLRDAGALVTAVERAADAWQALEAATGAPLLTPAHHALRSLARAHGGSAKPTGAGGGDLAWLVAPDAERQRALAEAARAAGYPTWTWPIAPGAGLLHDSATNRG